MTNQQEQAIIDAASHSLELDETKEFDICVANAVVAGIKKYDELVAANKTTDSHTNIANILKRQVQILADWNEQRCKECGYLAADIEQVRQNAKTIASIVPLLRLLDKEKSAFPTDNKNFNH